MNSSPLLTLPEELFLIILSHVKRRRDFVSLALTSKLIYHIVVPLFLDVIHIRCDPRRLGLWQWLASKPHLAATIQTLELYDEEQDLGRPMVPLSFSSDFALEPSRAREILEEGVFSLAAAVVLMKGLRRFRWSNELGPVPAFEILFISLEQLNVMDEFYFGVNVSSDDNEWIDDRLYSPLANFRNITTLSLSLEDYDGELGNLIPYWIIQLKQLNNLRLVFVGAPLNLSPICNYAHWPHLAELSLAGNMTFLKDSQDISDEENNVQATLGFGNLIRDHPTLQRLEFRNDNMDSIWSELIQPRTVYHLHSLIWYQNGLYDDPPLDHWHPVGIPQALQYLGCPISVKSIPALREMTSLRALLTPGIDLETFEHVVEAVPQIQQLGISCSLWYCDARADDGVDTRYIEDRVVTSLLKLKNLIQLEGLINYGGATYICKGVISRLMYHGCLLYIDSFNWRQLDLIIEHCQARKSNIDGLLRELSASVTIPDIEKSAGFCTTYPSMPFTVI